MFLLAENQMSKPSIKFGTDGWRGEISKDFTYENLSKVASAFIKYLKEKNLAHLGIAIGYDNRFQSEDFAMLCARIASGAGIKVLLSNHSLPSPALSYYVNKHNLAAGIMITASHNPFNWNGFKIKESFGGSARPEVTKSVEKYLDVLDNPDCPQNDKNIEYFYPFTEYLEHISSFVDLALIKNSGINVILDPMNGSGSGYLKRILPQITEINGNRDPLFHGINPEPLPINLIDLASYIKDSQGLSVGIAIDGDADRIAAYDPDGSYISSHNVFSLLLKHLYENKKLRGKVVKTFNISRLIEKQAKEYGLELKETPIGFKYIAEEFLTSDVLIGGEESGGIGIKGNIPERDGSLNALLLLELVSIEKKSLSQILKSIMDKHGYYYYDRIDLHVDTKFLAPKIAALKSKKEFLGKAIVKIEDLDGIKLNFDDGSWILFRPSGTEPLLRIYCEARSTDAVKLLLSQGENYIIS